MVAALEAVGLSKHYRAPGGGTVRAVDRASFTLQAGQVLGLLGGSGSGKTTLLRLLGGELRPTRGHVHVNVRPLLLDEPEPGAQIPSGATAVVATGDIATALSRCHLIGLMDRGRVLPLRSVAAVQAMCPADRYQLRVKGHLSERWARHFDQMRITNLPDGEALLEGTDMDQAALHGVLVRVRDLGMPLVSVARALPTLPELLAAWV